MNIDRAAVELIEQYARLKPDWAHQGERQSLIERLAKEHGIWNGYGGEDCQSWYTGQGERIGLLQPTVQDIEAMAGDLGVTFRAADHTFDLDKAGDPGFVGTFATTRAGIAAAYQALLLHQLLLQKIAEVESAREGAGEATTAK